MHLHYVNSPGVWESLGEFESVWEILGQFRRVWESLGEFGGVWGSLREFERVWESLVGVWEIPIVSHYSKQFLRF